MKKLDLLKHKLKMLKTFLDSMKELGENNKTLPRDYADGIIKAAKTELDRYYDRIVSRGQILIQNPKLRNPDCISGIQDNEILEGILQSLKELKGEDQKLAIYVMTALTAEEGFSDDKVESIIRYFNTSRFCEFPEVIKFINESPIYDLSKEEFVFNSLCIALEGYEKGRNKIPYTEKEKHDILSNISFISSEDLEVKSKESLIKIVNAAILTCIDSVSQIDHKDNEEMLLTLLTKFNIG